MRSYEEIVEFVEEEDVKFIRLAFVDAFGKLKNVAIMPENLERAFRSGIAFDAGAIRGFQSAGANSLFLYPDPETMELIPWRPMEGRVAKMFCTIKDAEGNLFENDPRQILRKAVKVASDQGIYFNVRTDFEFYLFDLDEHGKITNKPHDYAGYFDISPKDKGENIRREICFDLVNMGIQPRSSHHEEGPGQNEVDFEYSNPIKAADNALIFKWMVRNVADANGLYADFSPKPMKDRSGDGLHINFRVRSDDEVDYTDAFAAGILAHTKEMTLFLNPVEESYLRLGTGKAPKYVSWSEHSRTQLIRIPRGKEGRFVELRSPDPTANPYLALALLIYAGLDGIEKNMTLPEPVDADLNRNEAEAAGLERLPKTLEEAKAIAGESTFLESILPAAVLAEYRG